MLTVLVLATPAAAGRVRPEWWFGGGFTRSDYHDLHLAVGRAGVGAMFLEHVALGANIQADRERWFWMGYAGVILPAIGMIEPYARFHAGRRDDVEDTALGWTAGFRVGQGAVKLFVEAHGILEPGYGNGGSVGISF